MKDRCNSADKFDQFWAVNRRLMETPSGEEGFKNLPIRMFDKDTMLLQKLHKSVGEDRRKRTLGDLVQDTFGSDKKDEGKKRQRDTIANFPTNFLVGTELDLVSNLLSRGKFLRTLSLYLFRSPVQNELFQQRSFLCFQGYLHSIQSTVISCPRNVNLLQKMLILYCHGTQSFSCFVSSENRNAGDFTISGHSATMAFGTPELPR